MRYRFRVSIPLIGEPQYANTPLAHMLRGTLTQSDFNRLTWEAHMASLNSTLLKPGRRLGGAWIDDFVALGRNVMICATCNSRYGNWWSRHSYKPTEIVMGDCDGCGEPLVSCVKFIHEGDPQNQERTN